MNQPALKFRPRISLLAFLLAATVVCLGVSHWCTSRQLVTALVDLRKVRDELVRFCSSAYVYWVDVEMRPFD